MLHIPVTGLSCCMKECNSWGAGHQGLDYAFVGSCLERV